MDSVVHVSEPPEERLRTAATRGGRTPNGFVD